MARGIFKSRENHRHLSEKRTPQSTRRNNLGKLDENGEQGDLQWGSLGRFQKTVNKEKGVGKRCLFKGF